MRDFLNIENVTVTYNVGDCHIRGHHRGRVLPAMRAASLSLLSPGALAQRDTVTHGWPVTPFFATHPITGVFCEYRNTLTADHFHNGVDIPMPDGTPVHSVLDGVVTAIGAVASSGDNAYVRVRYPVVSAEP